ncbi:universal stress protein [Natronococcus sp. A-GB1]|uniref:universal stress protein n=1 Tax=Natronococcus sp. A-GB1 TaxID=3037648 RepID=UPI00242043EF|nr:universal stress protein [Natronococcus sp. A-GB1]MDG5761675.1 universal stress protein [Natronococcus sp. A-GB1]
MDTSSDTSSEDKPTLETAVLAVGGRDEERVADLVDTVKEVVTDNSQVIVVHVFDTESYTETVENIANKGGEYVDPDKLAAQMSVIQAIIGLFEENAINYDVRATTENKGDGIVEIATESDADRVIIGGRQRSPTGKALFGSMAQNVLLNAPCPVTFVRDAK